MRWFKKDKELLLPDESTPAFIEQHKSAVEIIAHKNATEEAKREVDEANEKIRKVFERNHFTVKLYVAAGGRQPKQTGVSK